MLPNRTYASGQSSSTRKSRFDGKHSLLPKPCDGRRPSNTGRSTSSADPVRGTIGGRLSREASATKLSLNTRSRSHTGETRHTQTMSTPQSSSYSRQTTTPVRTPGQEGRSWKTCLERAQACLTVKDQRPISNVVWQRSEYARVTEALTVRGETGALIRPLTIARFNEIVSALLAPLVFDGAKINKDTYITKLPHLSKRLLYPGTVTATWLRTVNTLHAFPQALALVAYLLDLVSYLETPVNDEWLYAKNDDLARLRRDYLKKSWIRFQGPDAQFEDLVREYQQSLKQLFGDMDGQHAKLEHLIKEYEEQVEECQSAQAEEKRCVEKRDAVGNSLRAVRSVRRKLAAELAELAEGHEKHAASVAHVVADTDRAKCELSQLSLQVERQSMSVEQRNAALNEVDYALRVVNSKSALAQELAKMVVSKDNDIALCQKRTLDSCMRYNQAMIHVASKHPHLSSLILNQKELRSGEFALQVVAALRDLEREGAALSERGTAAQRHRNKQRRTRAKLLEEHQDKISEMKAAIEREQQAIDTELVREGADSGAWGCEEALMMQRIQELDGKQQEYRKAADELEFWTKQKGLWETRLRELSEHVEEQRGAARDKLGQARARAERGAKDAVRAWQEALQPRADP